MSRLPGVTSRVEQDAIGFNVTEPATATLSRSENTAAVLINRRTVLLPG